jgi:hypothetical protein
MKALAQLLKPWMALVLGLTLVVAGPVAALGADDAHAVHGDANAPAADGAHDGHTHAQDHAEPAFLKQFAFSYLTAYMFCLSLCVGGLFLVLVHHLFDAGWSASIRRVSETLAGLLMPWMLVLVVPIIIFSWMGVLHPWFNLDPREDHALEVKSILFNKPTFTVLVPLLLVVLGALANTLKKWSLAQDKDGAAHWTTKSRKLAAGGIFAFAFLVTLLCFYLMKSLQHQFFSTMYGVYYFAGSVWTTLITMYVLVMLLSKPGGPLEKVVFKRQQQDLAVWFFAFTVFYAYIHFSQYFLIWNAAIPEETFWYALREVGSWKWVGFIILFGHFFVPFLMLLNQDIKRNLAIMFPMAAWAWLMHYVDMTYNIMPVIYPDGLNLTILDPVCWFGMAAFLGYMFWSAYSKVPPYPLKDPRLKEAVTHHEVPAPGAVTAH